MFPGGGEALALNAGFNVSGQGGTLLPVPGAGECAGNSFLVVVRGRDGWPGIALVAVCDLPSTRVSAAPLRRLPAGYPAHRPLAVIWYVSVFSSALSTALIETQPTCFVVMSPRR